MSCDDWRTRVNPGAVAPFAQSQLGTKDELFCDGPIKCFEDDRHEIVTLGAFDLLEGLDVVVLGSVHDRKDLGNEA